VEASIKDIAGGHLARRLPAEGNERSIYSAPFSPVGDQ